MIRTSLAVALTVIAASAVYPRQEPLPVPVPKGWRRLLGRRSRREAEEEQGALEAEQFLADVHDARNELPWSRPDADIKGDIQEVRKAEDFPDMMLRPHPGGKGRHRRVITRDGEVIRVDVTGAMAAAQAPSPRPGAPVSRPRRERRAPTIVMKVLDSIDEDLGRYLRGLPRYDDRP